MASASVAEQPKIETRQQITETPLLRDAWRRSGRQSDDRILDLEFQRAGAVLYRAIVVSSPAQVCELLKNVHDPAKHRVNFVDCLCACFGAIYNCATAHSCTFAQLATIDEADDGAREYTGPIRARLAARVRAALQPHLGALRAACDACEIALSEWDTVAVVAALSKEKEAWGLLLARESLFEPAPPVACQPTPPESTPEKASAYSQSLAAALLCTPPPSTLGKPNRKRERSLEEETPRSFSLRRSSQYIADCVFETPDVVDPASRPVSTTEQQST